MRISDEQVRKVINQREALVSEIQDMDLELEPSPRPTDGPLIEQVTKAVVQTPDREDRIAEVKAMIQAGLYNPSGDEIADAMVRRAIADKIR